MPENFVQISKKYDQALDKAQSHKYKLSIQISLDGFSFCIFNPEANKFISIESYSFEEFKQNRELVTYLERFFQTHDWLRLDYESVMMLYETDRSTLVPVPLYDPGEKDTIAGFNFALNTNEVVFADMLSHPDTYLIYPVPGELHSFFKSCYPDLILKCHSGVYVEALMVLYKNLPVRKRMFVNVRESHLDIVITEGKKLIFLNSFKYLSKEDFIYYIIFVTEQLNLNPEEIELEFSGHLDKSSECFDYAYKYVRNIRFLPMTDRYNYSYIFNDVPSHYYFNLLNSGLCEL